MSSRLGTREDKAGVASGARIDGDFTDATKAILTWVMKVFVNDPERTGGHLWVALRFMDGPCGYNQG